MPDSAQEQIEADSGLICLAMLARFQGIAVDPEQLKHSFSPTGSPFQTSQILLAARQLGLKAKCIKSHWQRLPSTPLPAIAISRTGEFFILAKIDDDQVLVQSPSSRTAKMLSRSEFENCWNEQLILMARRKGFLHKASAFNLHWFIPALYKYRRLFAEILLASFCLQLFALIMPLFFSGHYRQGIGSQRADNTQCAGCWATGCIGF